MRGLVPVTSRGDKSQCVNWSFLPQNCCRDQKLVLATSPQIQTGLNFRDKWLRLVLQNALWELFVGQVPVTSPFVFNFRGLVAGTRRRD